MLKSTTFLLLVSNFCYLCAGLRLSILNLPTLTVWVMTAFVVNQVLAEVILEIISFIYGQNKGKL